MSQISLPDFLTEINRILGLPGNDAKVSAALAFEARVAAVGAPSAYALYIFGQVFLRAENMPLARSRVLMLLERFPGDAQAADYAMRIAQDLMVLHDVLDELLVEALQQPARLRVLRDPSCIHAAACLQQFLIKAGKTALASRLRRRLLRHSPAERITGDVAAQRLALYDPAFGPDAADWDAPPQTAELVMRPARGAGEAAVLLYSGDATYWRAFGPGVLASCRRRAPDHPVHIHLVGAGDDVVAQLAAIQADDPDRFGYSVETLSASTTDGLRQSGQLKTYFACARFQILETALRTYGRTVCVLDMDTRLTKPLGPLLARDGGADVAVIVDHGRNPWHRSVACLSWYADTEQGRSFADYLRRYLNAFFARGLAFWTLDQVVLDVAIDRMRRTGGRFLPVPFVEARRHVAFAGQFIGGMTLEDKVRHLDRIA